jgi:hypothetical protein
MWPARRRSPRRPGSCRLRWLVGRRHS